jgi:hypothetical protein
MKLTVLVSGMISAVPRQGGATWAVLQYLLGFRRLGHDVYFVESVAPSALRPDGANLADSQNARYFRSVMAEFGFGQSAALFVEGSRASVGLSYDGLRHIAGRTDVLVNISGLLVDETLLERIPIRLYLDLDPTFTQLWHFAEGIDLRLAGHTHFATVGLGIGQSECTVPTGGLHWLRTLPPVVLEHWPVADKITLDALTTVANWRGYGAIDHNGTHYGQKAHSLRKLIDLPTRAKDRFVLALAIHPHETADLERLTTHRWELVDPESVVGTPDMYHAFVSGSWAEIGVAKSGYVLSRCGWFSDRSACYLASGRPVVAQDTGFSCWLPTGEGLLRFDTTDEAQAAIESLNAAYAHHARAARRLAEDWLDSDKVLATLLEQLATAP